MEGLIYSLNDEERRRGRDHKEAVRIMKEKSTIETNADYYD